MQDEQLIARIDDGIAVITLNRPQKRNAILAEQLRELDRLLDTQLAESSVRAIIITGAGDIAFASGADIGEMRSLTPLGAHQLSSNGNRIMRKLELSRKPVIAALNGLAFGAGLELAMSCHVRFAASHATFGMPEGKLGIMPGYGGTQRLPRLIGHGRALEMLLSGAPIDAEEALRIGLINRIVPASELLSFTLEWARTATRVNGAQSLAFMIEAVDIADRTTLDEGLRYESQAFSAIRATADGQEGLSAFVEKRSPHFRGH